MFSLIRQGEMHLNRIDQQSFQLQLNPDGSIAKDSSGQPVMQPFIAREPV